MTRRRSRSASTCPPARPRSPTACSSSKSTSRGRTHYVYLQRQPMATELDPARGRQLRGDRPRLPRRRLRARRDRAEPLADAAGRQAARRARPSRLDGGARRRLPVRRLRLARGRRARSASRSRRRRSRSSTAPWFDGTYGPGAARGSRRWCTSSRTCGSATASRRTSGATCGSTRATRPGTSGPSRPSTASSRRTSASPTSTTLMQAVYALGDHPAAPTTGRSRRPLSGDAGAAVQRPGLLRRRARALRAAPEDRRRDVPAHRARVGLALPRRSRVDADFIALASKVSGQNLHGVPERLALRDQDAADARPSGLDGRRPAAANRIAAAAPSGLLARAKR